MRNNSKEVPETPRMNANAERLYTLFPIPEFPLQ